MTWAMYFNFPINITDDDLKITPQEIGKENDASPTQRNDRCLHDIVIDTDTEAVVRAMIISGKVIATAIIKNIM